MVLDQGIDTSTAVGRMFFQILGSIAEFEHALMSERTRDGLAAARSRGRTGGQKPKLTPRQARIAQEMYDELGADGQHGVGSSANGSACGTGRPSPRPMATGRDRVDHREPALVLPDLPMSGSSRPRLVNPAE